MVNIDYDKIPKVAQTDICAMAIMRTVAAMASPEGREAIEKGKAKYLRHLAERERGCKDGNESSRAG